MKAGFLLSLTEPSLRRRGAPPLLDARRAARGGRARARARATSPRCAAARRGDWQGACARLGRDAARAAARRARAAVGAAVRLLPRRRRAPARSASRACCRHGATTIRCDRYVLGHARLRPRGVGRYAEAEAGRPRAPGGDGARAVGDPCRGPRHGDAGPARRRRAPGWRAPAAALGARATASPATSAGTRRCSRSRPATIAGALALFDAYLEGRRPTRSRCSASTPRRCSGACTCSAPMSATRWRASLAAGRSTTAAAGQSAFNDVHALLALLGAGERGAARRPGSRTSLARRRARAALATATMAREIGAPLMHGLLAFARRRIADAAAELLRRCAAALARASAAAMRSATSSTRPCSPRPRAAPARAAGRALLAERQRARARDAAHASGGRGRSTHAARPDRGRAAECGRAAPPPSQTSGGASSSVANARCTAGPREHAVVPGTASACGRLRAGRREAAGPAAEHEGVGIDRC